MQELFDKYGVYALFLYLFIERTFPLLGKALDKIIPAFLRRRKALEDETLELENGKLEAQQRADQLKEREISAMENISKNLAITHTKFDKIDSRLDMNERTLTQVSLSMATANQTLAVLLDRSTRRREDFEQPEDTKPIKTIRRKK